jgi:hypothetical protein
MTGRAPAVSDAIKETQRLKIILAARLQKLTAGGSRRLNKTKKQLK